MNYYNEHDPKAAEWLRELIKAGHISNGEVDERSIEDVLPNDLRPFRQCHFFAGIGVWSLALRRAGISDDERIWTGSCPCQPFSQAGEGKGTADERHLWPALHWLIKQCQPELVLGEQVASALDWWDLVASDLEDCGYAAGASITTAGGFGGYHIRKRLYWVANANEHQQRQRRGHGAQTCQGAESERRPGDNGENIDWLDFTDGKRRPIEPGIMPMVDAYPGRVGLLRGYGNALDARQAEAFVRAAV